ncbi:MAG: hypothetical protein ICV68_14730 [Pyrinomonadaceae bacterium]|nr:hypothetical protein [Pyrinomonadaceae bacterium]
MSLARLTGCMMALAFAASAGESSTCRDCQQQKSRPADEMRLRPACVDSLDTDGYCRWVVRAERTGANRAAHIPTADDKQIEATLSAFKLVQPPQYLRRHATVLVLNEAGEFLVVRLEKTLEKTKDTQSEEWRVTEVVEPAMKEGAAQ